MGCYMKFIIPMYILLSHHFTLVLGPVIFELIHHGVRQVYGVILQPYVRANDVATINIYHVFYSLVHRR